MQSFQALGAPPPDPQISPHHCKSLATRLVASKILEQAICINKLLKKILQCRCFATGLYLIIAKQRFAINSADAIKISNFFERRDIRLQTPVYYTKLFSD